MSLTKKDDPTTRAIDDLYPVKLAEVLTHATSSRILNQEKFSRISIDTMHRLEVFDKATTSARRIRFESSRQSVRAERRILYSLLTAQTRKDSAERFMESFKKTRTIQ